MSLSDGRKKNQIRFIQQPDIFLFAFTKCYFTLLNNYYCQSLKVSDDGVTHCVKLFF
jgi:hypothetical protein